MTQSLWSMRASRAEWLDKIEVRSLTADEVREIRIRVDAEADAGPFACDCLQCKLRRLQEPR